MIKKYCVILLFSLWAIYGRSQETQTTQKVEQQMEDLTEANESETEDDSYIQQLLFLRRSPLNLNTASESDLTVFKNLSALQIQQFLKYRQVLGKLLSFYELQAVPGWDVETIKYIQPYAYVGPAESVAESFFSRFRGGFNTILMRYSQVLEKQRGFIPDAEGKTKYLGNNHRYLFRYKYQFKNLLQFGLVGDKDAGEQFFKGAQKNGFDFYSFHLFARNLGNVKRLALGDFTVNMGQGLLTFQSLAFRKSADVTNVKRQAEIFRPYNSAGEFNFHRGVATTVQVGIFHVSAFASYKKASASTTIADTAENFEDYFSSVLTSGYHRTETEAGNRNTITQTTFGGNVQYKKNNLQIGINAIRYHLSMPMVKSDAPYNMFAASGKSLGGYSLDYGYTRKNVHFFGEAAMDLDRKMAHVHGLIASLHRLVDFSAVYRNISPKYNSLYANAFTESTQPKNERGLYTGLSFKPSYTWRIDAYADVFTFPWLRYRVDRPSKGGEYLLQVNWRPNRQFEMYTRFRRESKAINLSNTPDPFKITDNIPRSNWRTQFTYKLSPAVQLRSRAEFVWYNTSNPALAEKGTTIYADLIYKPPMSALTCNARFQFFQTDGYNSRVYAYENDVLYSFSIPALYGTGTRAYVNLNYDLTKKLTMWFRIARTMYNDQQTIGSGYDIIYGNHKTDFRIQMQYTF